MGLLQVLFDQLIWHAIDAKISPVSIPVKLGLLLEPSLDLTLSKSKLNIAHVYSYA